MAPISSLLRAAATAAITLVCGASLLASCDNAGGSTGLQKSLPPMPLELTTNARSTTSTTDDGVDLLVTATMRNTRDSSITVLSGLACAPFVALFANPSGQYQGHLSPAMACPPLSPTITVAPGDSITLATRVLARDLAGYPPGTYGIDVAVTTVRDLVGRSAGNIELPLRAPSP